MLASMALTGTGARSQEPAVAPEPNSVSGEVRVDACASDPSRLGLSRVVEIDTAGGPQFGGGHGHGTDFLKDGEVILTFDDGPLRAYTRPVLKALAGHCTKATFFMVGRMAASDPGMVREIASAGHTVASHTWSHQNLRPLGLFKARTEFEKGLAAVNKALGRPAAAFFRFPYLSESRLITEHLQSRNVSALWVDVDSKDYLTRDPKVVHRRIMADLSIKRKGIILMHDIQPSTAGAIKGLLDELHAKGFKVVHVVPKATVDTIAAYDGAVAKAFDDKAAAADGNPLASRSVVWSMSPSTAGAATGARKAPAKTGAGKAQNAGKATPASSSDDLPWLVPPGKPAPDATSAAQKPVKAAKPKADQLPWQPNVFGY